MYDTLKRNDCMKMFNTLNSFDSFEKSYNPLKHADSADSIDYINDIDDSVDDIFYNVYADNNFHNDYIHYTQQLNSLDHYNQYRKTNDTFTYEDNYKNYHGMLKDPFLNRHKPKKKSIFLHLTKFMKKPDIKYEAKIVKIMER
ncbi:hypothetical protein POVCU2_0007510 [Plasmodium ovale curtisi]|uniref:Pv-fam-d protein n=1 Tax=Plasmodium ovale curtisi TaxID=864141 RepID=A0A1A8XGG8_PLAOA|nr:hypothetical protein POVCU2_0007510 [Plasmodium ovale curtisi]SBT03028.1 hypothetical protein POVCU1_083360 [Plasmodium ovale curtisi]